MKSFRNYISEEVLPSVQVADGGLDIEKPAVRAAINAAIAGVVSQPAVTPYVVYNRLSKLLAQYHIVLPKRFLEGDKGVEVFEVKQFGHRMGMTDGGEFVNQVPSTHYLFLQYGIITPMGVTYAKPIVGGMFRVTARLVDKAELDKLLDMAEITMAEEAECRQMAAKAHAPKEEMKDITDDPKKVGNKSAVSSSERGLDEEKNDLKDACWKGYTAKGLKKKGGKMVPNCVPVSEEQIDEVSKGAAIRAYGAAKDASDSDSRAETTAGRLKKHIATKFGAKTVKHAERHAYASHFGRPGTDYGTDRLSRAKPSSKMRKNKSGKIHKQDVESKKSEIKFRKNMSKFDKPRGHLPEETEKKPLYKVGAAKGHESGDRYERRDYSTHSSIVKTHQGGKETKNEWGGHSPLRVGKPAYIAKHFAKLKEEKGDRLTPGFGNRKDFDTIAKEIGTGKGGMTIAARGEKGGDVKQTTLYPMSPKSSERVAPDDVAKKLDQSTRGNPQAERNSDLQEKAPPGAKFERMVKHIKKGYSKGGLSAKEKSIAYATAWKAKNREEAGE